MQTWGGAAVATFDGVDLGLESGGGALIHVKGSFHGSATVIDREGRGEVIIPASGHVAVVRGLACSGFEEAVETARDLTRLVLEPLVSRGSIDVEATIEDHPMVAWWPSAAGTTIRVVGSASWAPAPPRPRDGARVAFETRNAYPAQGTPWSDALRLYRVSEASDDAEDATAHLYRALATVLETRVHVFRAESERSWLLRALVVENRDLDLAPYAPPTSTKSPPEAIRDELYGDLRRASHPGVHEWRDLLPAVRNPHGHGASAHARYAALFRQLARAHLGLTFPSIAATAAERRAPLRSRLSRSVVWIGEERTGSTGAVGARLRLPTRDMSRTADARDHAVVGKTTDLAVAAGVGTMRSFGTLDHERVTSATNLSGPLDVTGADAIEIVVREPAADIRAAHASTQPRG